MKSIFIAISVLSVLGGQAQSLKYSAFLSSNLSGYTDDFLRKDNPTFSDLGIGASSGFITEYYFQKSISVGASISYFLTRGEFHTPCYCIHPYDRNISIRNFIAAHSIDVPVFFKLRINKNPNYFTYFQSGMGLSWLLYAHRKVEYEVQFLHTYPEPIRTALSNESFFLPNNNENEIGAFFQIGVGQNFHIKQINFFTELSYRQDVNSWIYKNETAYEIPDFSIQRRSILLKMGITFGQKKKENKH